MEVEIRTFPIDITITVHNCDEFDEVFRMTRKIANKEVDTLFKEVRAFEKEQEKSVKKSKRQKRSKMIPSDEWLISEDVRQVMKAMDEFTVRDLCKALGLTATERNLYRCRNHIGRGIREGYMRKLTFKRKNANGKRLSSVYTWVYS